MMRFVGFSVAVALPLMALSFTAMSAQAAPASKRPKPVWHGYGFLPGYRQPPSNSQPLNVQKNVSRRSPRDKRPWYIDPTPAYFGYDGDWHYFGWPGFARGRYNGGSFGPCWTRTPVGPVWTCG